MTDPNEVLRRIRAEVGAYRNAGWSADGNVEASADELCDLVEALDAHLSGGGERPDAWRPDDADPLLTTREVATRMGIEPGTWRMLVSQGYAPPADDPDEDKPDGERRPKWRASTIDRFKASRPGRGRTAARYPKRGEEGEGQ